MVTQLVRRDIRHETKDGEVRKDNGRTRRDKNKTAKWQDKTRRRDVVCGRVRAGEGREDAVSRVADHADDRECTSVSWSTNFKLRYTDSYYASRGVQCCWSALGTHSLVSNSAPVNTTWIAWWYVIILESKSNVTFLTKYLYIYKINGHSINQFFITYFWSQYCSNDASD